MSYQNERLLRDIAPLTARSDRGKRGVFLSSPFFIERFFNV
jgi:hypothetical protein